MFRRLACGGTPAFLLFVLFLVDEYSRFDLSKHHLIAVNRSVRFM
jgi:hypothetical protein